MSLTDKIRYVGKVKIVKDDYVLKEKKKDLNYLYQYLSSKDFYNYPELLDENDKFYKFKYINTKRGANIDEALSILGTLHNKTSEEKYVNKNSYDKVYNKLKENIIHVKYYYETFINKIEQQDFFSPAQYLFMRNLSKLLSMMKYNEDTIEKWYKLVQEKSTERVCVIHNNFRLNHTLIGKEDMITSFDEYTIDSPVIDLYKFYKNEGYNTEILDKLYVYETVNKLSEEEKYLFKILVTLPTKISLNDIEYNNVKNVRNFVNSVYKTEEFVSQKNSEEETKNDL